MIHFISSRDHIGLSILTSLALHRYVGPLAPSLAQASLSHVIPRFEASDLPFTLGTGPSSQVMSWSSPPWSHDSMSCLMCIELLHHCHSHFFKNKMECIILCAPRDQTHISWQIKGSMITSVITSRLLSYSLYIIITQKKDNYLVVAPCTGTLTSWPQD
jgi:hypothetical protein